MFPLDWRTTIHWKGCFKLTHIFQISWEIGWLTFQCIIVLPSMGKIASSVQFLEGKRLTDFLASFVPLNRGLCVIFTYFNHTYLKQRKSADFLMQGVFGYQNTLYVTAVNFGGICRLTRKYFFFRDPIIRFLKNYYPKYPLHWRCYLKNQICLRWTYVLIILWALIFVQFLNVHGNSKKSWGPKCNWILKRHSYTVPCEAQGRGFFRRADSFF